jgi:two-component system OmpR family response regulator
VRILVVEDEARLASALQRGLQAEGFAVDIAGDGPTGLDLARHGEYDAMILDVMLPGLSGYRVVRALRAEGHWLPVLMLSAKDGEHDQADGLDCGADDYLTKPFSFPVLIARVRAVLRRVGGRQAPVPAEAGDLRIDPMARKVWRAGTEVTLTARQFDVLEFLVRRAGQVVSKREILDGVWEYDFLGDPNIVEVYVRRLRAAIDEPFGRHAIETVRGAGYRLAVDGG